MLAFKIMSYITTELVNILKLRLHELDETTHLTELIFLTFYLKYLCWCLVARLQPAALQPHGRVAPQGGLSLGFSRQE